MSPPTKGVARRARSTSASAAARVESGRESRPPRPRTPERRGFEAPAGEEPSDERDLDAWSDPGPKALTKTGLAAPVLVLNRSFQPVRITTAREAFTLVYLGRARALDEGFEPVEFERWARLPIRAEDDSIGTTHGPIRIPRVILLSHYNRVPAAPLRLSRRNVFLRDRFTCQYCGERPVLRELNLDHVVPRAKGGRSTWENLVTSCRRCNVAKGDRSLETTGMALRSQPHRPNWSMALQMSAPSTRFAEWEPFLQSVAPRED